MSERERHLLRDATNVPVPSRRTRPRVQRFECPCGCGRRSAFTQPRSLRFVAKAVS